MLLLLCSCLGARLAELKKQEVEFRRVRADFLESDPESFSASRLFAREVYNRFATCLPIYAERTAIVAALEDPFAVLVLTAETGSGKSTQVVQYLEEVVAGQVVCTQPRRVAASTLADRVADEMQTQRPTEGSANLVECGGGGGRGSSVRPRIEFTTDASLLNRLNRDPMLKSVSVVVVDEVHERSVNTDVLIALLRRTLRLRAASNEKKPLKLVLTSATMNHALFAKFFSRKEWDPSSPNDGTWAPVLAVGGRTFPVAVHYRPEMGTDYEKAAEQMVLELDDELPPTGDAGNHDILVFLTASAEVDRLSRVLQKALPHSLCVPLHGSLDKDDQRRAFVPIDSAKYRRKIVVSTNIAEASVTIDGIGAVVDPGLEKSAVYDPTKDATVLRIAPISQSSGTMSPTCSHALRLGLCVSCH